MLDKIANLRKCKYCDAKFETVKKRIEHVNQVHLVRIPKDFLCFQCGKSFSSDRNLEIHEKTVHSGKEKTKEPKGFTCEQCGKTFSKTYYTLQKHVEQGIQIASVAFYVLFSMQKSLCINIFQSTSTIFMILST